MLICSLEMLHNKHEGTPNSSQDLYWREILWGPDISQKTHQMAHLQQSFYRYQKDFLCVDLVFLLFITRIKRIFICRIGFLLFLIRILISTYDICWIAALKCYIINMKAHQIALKTSKPILKRNNLGTWFFLS